MEIIIDNQKENENKLLISLLLSSLFCTMAGAIPKSLIIPKKVIITVATATIPKSSGDSIRDNTAVIIREINIPLYLEIAVKPIPKISCFFIEDIKLTNRYYLKIIQKSLPLHYNLVNRELFNVSDSTITH